jgi:hypothetical protein
MKRSVKSLLKQITDLEFRLKRIQDKCKHEHFESANTGLTGNFCPDDDRFYVSVKCLDCDKRMTFWSDKNPEEYRKFLKR